MAEKTGEENLLLYTCRVCKTTVAEDEINCHPCLEGYDNFYVDDNLYFYPQYNDEQTSQNSQSAVDDAEANLVETSQVHTNKKTNIETDWRSNKILQEEQLIEEVHKRPSLWNFKLPLAERSLLIKKKLWEEVATSMNGIMDIASIKKKWKSLCDSFRIHRSKQHQSSGSAGTSRKRWVHYDQMQFLCDAQLESESATNISTFQNHEELDQSNDGDSIVFDDSSSGRGSRASKRRLSIGGISVEETLDRLTDALSQPVTVNVPSNPSSQTDKAALFGSLIAAQLREVDPHFVDDTMLQVMQLINAAKKRKVNK